MPDLYSIPDADDLAEALRSELQAVQRTAPRPPSLDDIEARAAAPLIDIAPRSAHPAWVRRAVAAALVVALGVAGLVATRPDREAGSLGVASEGTGEAGDTPAEGLDPDGGAFDAANDDSAVDGPAGTPPEEALDLPDDFPAFMLGGPDWVLEFSHGEHAPGEALSVESIFRRGDLEMEIRIMSGDDDDLQGYIDDRRASAAGPAEQGEVFGQPVAIHRYAGENGRFTGLWGQDGLIIEFVANAESLDEFTALLAELRMVPVEEFEAALPTPTSA